MKKLIFSTMLTLAMVGGAIAFDSVPQSIDTGGKCITKAQVAYTMISNIPDAVGQDKGNVIIFSAPTSHPDDNLIVTFDDKGCAITTQIVPAHAS